MEAGAVYNRRFMGHDIPPCGVCGQRDDSTLILDQYGGACPYCIGVLSPMEPAAPAEDEIAPCGVCGHRAPSAEIRDQFGGACPYCMGALEPPTGEPEPAPAQNPEVAG